MSDYTGRTAGIVVCIFLFCVSLIAAAVANDATQVSRVVVVVDARAALSTAGTPDNASLSHAAWDALPTVALGNANKVALVANFTDSSATGKVRLIRGWSDTSGTWHPSPFTTTADVAPIATFTNADGTHPSEAVDFDTLGFPAAKVSEFATKGSISVTAAIR